MFRQRSGPVAAGHPAPPPTRPDRRPFAVRLAGAAIPAVIAIASTMAVAAPAEAGHFTIPVRGAGYVWAHNATAPLNTPYTPSLTYSRNTVNDGFGSHGENTVTRTGTGAYTVRYPNIGVIGGTVQVTAYGTDTVQCKVSSWGAIGIDQQVFVRCHSLAGSPANSRFVASYTNANHTPLEGTFAYLWANQPAAASYTPSLTYQHNSAGGSNTIQRTGVGSYTATLPDIGGSGGHVQVTGYGPGTERCKVASWGPSGTSERVNVRCFTSAGLAVDTRFTLTFAAQNNVIGMPTCCHPNGRRTSYAWADNPTAASYTLSPFYTWTTSHPPGEAEATRPSTGRYSVSFFNGFTGAQTALDDGTVSVTAYGSGPEFCKIVGWSTGGGIVVWCFDANGAPVDTRYTVAHLSNWILG